MAGSASRLTDRYTNLETSGFLRFLGFGTAGWATGNPSTVFALTGAAPFVMTGGKSDGWTAGAGIEYAITDSILGRIEYRYTNLETSGFLNIPANVADGGTRAPISDFRAGFAYKFGGAPHAPLYYRAPTSPRSGRHRIACCSSWVCRYRCPFTSALADGRCRARLRLHCTGYFGR